MHKVTIPIRLCLALPHSRCINWTAAYKNWCRRSVKYKNKKNKITPHNTYTVYNINTGRGVLVYISPLPVLRAGDHGSSNLKLHWATNQTASTLGANANRFNCYFNFFKWAISLLSFNAIKPFDNKHFRNSSASFFSASLYAFFFFFFFLLILVVFFFVFVSPTSLIAPNMFYVRDQTIFVQRQCLWMSPCICSVTNRKTKEKKTKTKIKKKQKKIA